MVVDGADARLCMWLKSTGWEGKDEKRKDVVRFFQRGLLCSPYKVLRTSISILFRRRAILQINPLHLISTGQLPSPLRSQSFKGSVFWSSKLEFVVDFQAMCLFYGIARSRSDTGVATDKR
jgi:hypothetical protein